jgi:hypothetical protein
MNIFAYLNNMVFKQFHLYAPLQLNILMEFQLAPRVAYVSWKILDSCKWTQADCFPLVVSIPMVCLLTALAAHKQHSLKQGGCKFAFIQAHLLDDKLAIVKRPTGCPFSGPRNYWRLRESLYGLCNASCHWYQFYLRSSNLLNLVSNLPKILL